MYVHAHSFAEAWYYLLANLVKHGQVVKPRGMPCREVLGVQVTVDAALLNTFHCPVRQLNHKFSVAEWLWIWYGQEDVATIAQYNKQIAQFSDNGEYFAGAYGPRVVQQWLRVGQTLRRDPDSRQAIIQIYQPPQEQTKDVPCTVSFQMFIRNGDLHGVVVMRSSDVWLGLPYDFYNFSQLLNTMAAQLEVGVGSLTYQLGSSHLYEVNYEAAVQILTEQGVPDIMESPRFTEAPPPFLNDILRTPGPLMRWLEPGFEDPVMGNFAIDRDMPQPWLTYARVLAAPNKQEARRLLYTLESVDDTPES